MNYQDRVEKVIKFIGQNLDEKISLTQLSEIACFSPYHFHRLFTAHTGLSLRQYIRWLRLKRAAHQLIIHQDQAIIDIAINAGFESHEAFGRIFKQICGKSPSEFRACLDWSLWEKPPYDLPQQEGNFIVNITIKTMQARRLAAVEHRGDPAKVAESVNRLIAWRKANTLGKPKAGEAFGFAYDDPNTTEPENFRFDLAVTVPANIKIEGEIIEKSLPAGRYAVAMHKGSHSTIGDTVYGLYRAWLPNSGEELGELPCIFCYHNVEHEVAETELLTECWLLLK